MAQEFNHSSILAFLFVKIYKEDPNAELPDELKVTTTNFLNGCADVLSTLKDWMTEEQIQWHMYEIGKVHYGIEKKQLKEWFSHLYLLTYGQPSGPRWGTWIEIFGVDGFKKLLTDRLNKPFFYY